MQKQQAFEAEMAANEERVLQIIATTNRMCKQIFWCLDLHIVAIDSIELLSFTSELIEEKKCASNEEVVKERITKLQEVWEKLTKLSQSKSRYLMESNQVQQYNNNVKELDYWLNEVCLSFMKGQDC